MGNTKNNLKLAFNEINHFLNEVVFKIRFYLPLLFITFISYGFNLFNRTIFIDDLAQDLYYGSGNIKLRGLRWGQWITNRIFSTVEFTPFINKFLGVIFFVLTSIVLCAIFYHLDNNKENKWKYTIFACIFISNPLINEFFGYYEALTIPFQFLLVSLSVLYQLINRKIDVTDIVINGIVMSFIMSGYESLVFVYILLVLIILFFEYVINENKNGWVKEGLRYAYPLVIALLLRYLIGYTILGITSMKYEMDGTENIVWLQSGFIDGVKGLSMNAWYYGIRALSYMPIGVFVISLLVFVVCMIKKQFHSKWSVVLGLLIIISTFGLGILQGLVLPYRAAQTIYVFVGFVTYTLLNEINDKTISSILVCVLLFVSYRQAVYLHAIFALDNQRSDNEASVVSNIGYELYSNYDLNKKVIFCGEYNIGDDIESQISIKKDSFALKVEEKIRDLMGDDDRPVYSEFINTNVNSVLNWTRKSYDGQALMKKYFSYYGYEIKVEEDWSDLTSQEQKQLLKSYTKIAEDNKMNPLSIKDMNDYILVYLGPYINE